MKSLYRETPLEIFFCDGVRIFSLIVYQLFFNRRNAMNYGSGKRYANWKRGDMCKKNQDFGTTKTSETFPISNGVRP